ncbi:neuronal migration protein doublecortin-like, partial [Lingula anatina]|uniref:Neuronal migration protein doublecortin-like n=1 Tax=Lingula anatina TaxID=7574 RepID=A0A2R2MQG1_LINAN
LARNKALTRPYEDAGRFEASKLREAKDTGPNKGHGHKKFSKRGRLVTFYRNDDPHFKGIQTAVSQKCFVSFETLLSWLTEKIPLTKGVRHVFSLPEGREITDVKDFVGGKDYVVSNDKKIRLNVQYGNSKEQYWNNRKPSAGKFRKHEKQLFLGENGDVLSTSNASPRILSIMSNTHRNSIEKVILNPKTNQTFEEMLEDITAMLKLLKPPVTSLYTAKEPFRKKTYELIKRPPTEETIFEEIEDEEGEEEEGDGEAKGGNTTDRKDNAKDTSGQSDTSAGLPSQLRRALREEIRQRAESVLDSSRYGDTVTPSASLLQDTGKQSPDGKKDAASSKGTSGNDEGDRKYFALNLP